MKKVILGILMALMLSTAAFAGPLLGLQLVPTAGTAVGFEAGWAFDHSNFVIQKTDLSSVYGDFSLAGIWTPVGDGFKYRGGVAIGLKYGTYDAGWSAGPLVYNGLTFIIGAQKTWAPFTIYGDVQISSVGIITPVLGVDVLFDLFGSSKAQPIAEY